MPGFETNYSMRIVAAASVEKLGSSGKQHYFAFVASTNTTPYLSSFAAGALSWLGTSHHQIKITLLRRPGSL